MNLQGLLAFASHPTITPSYFTVAIRNEIDEIGLYSINYTARVDTDFFGFELRFKNDIYYSLTRIPWYDGTSTTHARLFEVPNNSVYCYGIFITTIMHSRIHFIK